MEILTKAFYKSVEEMILKSDKTIDDAKIGDIVRDSIPNVIQKTAKSVRDSLNENTNEMLLERRKLFTEFCERNYNRWQPAFDLFEAFLVICTEAGEEFNKTYRPTAAETNDVVFDLVVRHHARACNIGQEILCLLKSGFPDGAHARWRALHEVAATAMFIAKHGRECAEMFYWHEIVESYKGMLQHKKYEHKLNEKGPSDQELREYEILYNQVKAKYGKEFTQPYGWASSSLDRQRVTFADIEKDVSLDHMRPYYKWASQNVHAGAKGISNRIGLCEATEDLLLVGQSNSGMTDPAHSSAISLTQVTTVLLNIKPNIDRLVILNILLKMEDEIGEIFLSCDTGKDS